jgi:hypothetical protein
VGDGQFGGDLGIEGEDSFGAELVVFCGLVGGEELLAELQGGGGWFFLLFFERGGLFGFGLFLFVGGLFFRRLLRCLFLLCFNFGVFLLALRWLWDGCFFILCLFVNDCFIVGWFVGDWLGDRFVFCLLFFERDSCLVSRGDDLLRLFGRVFFLFVLMGGFLRSLVGVCGFVMGSLVV